MAIKHFKASEHSPESASAFKLEDHLTMTTIDQIHSQSANEGNRLMPTVFTLEEGQPITAKVVGPSALYVIEGELVVEDTADPEKPFYLTAGDVLLIDEGTINKTSTPSKGRGFAISAYLPAPLILPDLQVK